jgi:hypothetical protein
MAINKIYLTFAKSESRKQKKVKKNPRRENVKIVKKEK